MVPAILSFRANRTTGGLRCLAAGILLAGMTGHCVAQLQYPGRPAGMTGNYRAGDVMYVLPPVDPLEIDAALQENRVSDKKSMHFALEREVGIEPSVNGVWMSLPDYRLWRVHIVSPGAGSVGLLFKNFRLFEGVRIFVYDPDMRHVRGAFTSGNNKSSGLFGTGHIPGGEVVVEMQVPLHLAEYGELRIGSVSHGFLTPGRALKPDDLRFGLSQECEIDILCEEGSDWQDSRRSVVRIFAPSRTLSQYCTGVLLNNSSYNGSPYVLTAEHCINTGDIAASSIFVFNYESPGCFGGDGSVEMSIFGSELLATSDSIDFSLVKLSAVPPDTFDVCYAGWDRSGGQVSYTTTIHHPMGDVKKISYDFQAPSTPESIDDLPDSDLRDYYFHSLWWIRQWDIGSTEGGSSGGPLFNSSRRVIGTLSGGKAECGKEIGYDPVADRNIYSKVPNVNDYFTRLGVAWDHYDDPAASLKPWLDPEGTGTLFLDGYEPSRAATPATVAARFRVYPNPAGDFLVIEPGGPMAGRVSCRMTDLSGRVVLEGSGGEAGSIRLPVEHLGQGIYLLIIGAEGREEYHKIMVSR